MDTSIFKLQFVVFALVSASFTCIYISQPVLPVIQGVFIPGLTTSIAAWLARTLPVERLSVVMGSYVSATVLGGLGGRLLGGWIHPPLHWRYALVSASVLVMVTTIAAIILLPRGHVQEKEYSAAEFGFPQLLKQRDLLAIYCCGVCHVFSGHPGCCWYP